MFMREFCWVRGSESNRRIKVLQTSPLPLGYRAPAPYVSVPCGKSLPVGKRKLWAVELRHGERLQLKTQIRAWRRSGLPGQDGRGSREARQALRQSGVHVRFNRYVARAQSVA